ncbi:MAG: isoprenylcysteine carboxylmethyltransferase family protein [Pseudomonadales bacterium]
MFDGHSGSWAIALIMIVLASWVFYRYFAPRSWREWAGAGLIQAFVIALYAEMYGFPLTIYLLARFTELDRDYISANLWSTLLGVGEAGMLISMIIGYGLLFVGIGLFARGWRQVYQSKAEQALVTSGLYRFVRHPQYTGLFIALFGEGVVHWPTLFSIGLFPIIVYAYYRLARREERQLLGTFGKAYAEYQRQTPMFVPRFSKWRGFVKRSADDPAQSEAQQESDDAVK